MTSAKNKGFEIIQLCVGFLELERMVSIEEDDILINHELQDVITRQGAEDQRSGQFIYQVQVIRLLNIQLLKAEVTKIPKTQSNLA